MTVNKQEAGAIVRFVCTGPREKVELARRQISRELGVKKISQVPVPVSARAHIIGRNGATVQEIMKKSGVKIQVPKIEMPSAGLEQDDSDSIMVEIEGDPLGLAYASQQVENIANARTSSTNLRLKDIPPEFFHFIAGPHDSRISAMEQGKDVQVRVPFSHVWQERAPPRMTQQNRSPVFLPHSDKHITISGERNAAQQVRTDIERHVELLRQQLILEEQNVQRGLHQFIIGERGMSPHDFLQETGCVIILPPPHADTEDITIIGPRGQIEIGINRATALAAEMMSSNIDPRRQITNAPHGVDAHARALVQYLRDRKLEEELQGLYDAHIVFPPVTDPSGSWDIFSRDMKNVNRARADLANIIRAYPPTRLTLVEVDPFFHPHLKQRCAQSLKTDFGVHLIVPPQNGLDAVVLVYEGPQTAESGFEIPRQRPTDAEISTFEEALEQARNQILSIIGDQEDIASKNVDLPRK